METTNKNLAIPYQAVYNDDSKGILSNWHGVIITTVFFKKNADVMDHMIGLASLN